MIRVQTHSESDEASLELAAKPCETKQAFAHGDGVLGLFPRIDPAGRGDKLGVQLEELEFSFGKAAGDKFRG